MSSSSLTSLSTWWINKIEGKIPKASFGCSVSHLINCNQIYVDEACLIDEFVIYQFAQFCNCLRSSTSLMEMNESLKRKSKEREALKLMLSLENNSIRFDPMQEASWCWCIQTTAVCERQVANSNRDFHGTVNTSTLILLLIFY